MTPVEMALCILVVGLVVAVLLLSQRGGKVERRLADVERWQEEMRPAKAREERRQRRVAARERERERREAAHGRAH